MKNLILLTVAAVSFMLCTASSCEKGKKTAECPPNTICTMMFASIGTKVTDNKGTPVTFSEAYTLRKSNNELLTYEQNNKEGFYVIVDDSYQKSLANQTDTFLFVGKQGGQTIVEEPFIISADCCHVNKISGKSEIIIP